MKIRVLILLLLLGGVEIVGCCGYDVENYYANVEVSNPCLSTDFVVSITPADVDVSEFKEGPGEYYVNSCGLGSLMDRCEEKFTLIWNSEVGQTVEMNFVVMRKGEEKPAYGRVISIRGTNGKCGYDNPVTIPSRICKYKLF